MTAARREPVLLAVCGLAFEARVVAGPSIRTVTGGGDARALGSAIHRHLDDGAIAIISVGLAGGLDPRLDAGTLVIADAIVCDTRREPVDTRWTQALRDALPHATHASIAGSNTVVVDRDAKAALRRVSNAAAVDMESHVAARIARERGVPFVALRAISDPGTRDLPALASSAMRADGRVDSAAVLRALLKEPAAIPTLVRVGLDTRAALRGLRDARRLLGPRLGHADLDELPVHVV